MTALTTTDVLGPAVSVSCAVVMLPRQASCLPQAILSLLNSGNTDVCTVWLVLQFFLFLLFIYLFVLRHGLSM